MIMQGSSSTIKSVRSSSSKGQIGPNMKENSRVLRYEEAIRADDVINIILLKFTEGGYHKKAFSFSN